MQAYADDIVLVARNERALRETFQTLEREGRDLGLKLNEEKTKYMAMAGAGRTERQGNFFTAAEYCFERVNHFTYLGTVITDKNNISHEIRRRIVLGNRAFYANSKILKSRLIDRTTKVKVYETLIRPVVTYGCEAWTLSASDTNALRVFERKVMRRIYGPVNDDGMWRIRHNSEIEVILCNRNIVRFVKSRRIGWLGHVVRMPQQRLQREILDGVIDSVRRRGRPRMRWKQDVVRDLGVMGVRNWSVVAGRREDWRRIVEEAKVHIGL